MISPSLHRESARMRLFIALWPDARTRDKIAAWQGEWDWPPRAALVRPERLHLTLHFLGDVPARRLPELAAGLRVGFEPFTMELGAGETWPGGVAVLRPGRTVPALERLHQALAGALTELGFVPEARAFRAHVTLARRAQGATPPREGAACRWHVGAGYVLVQSLPAGAGYKRVALFA